MFSNLAGGPGPMVPGPYGRRFPVPFSMPMPGSMPVPGGSLPPLPLPPWSDWPGTAVQPAVVQPAAIQPASVQPASVQPAADPTYPPSTLDFQTTVTFNPVTSRVPVASLPTLHPTVYVAPHASILGDITIGEDVFIGFGAVLRADCGSPFHIGPRSSIQDHVVVHGEPEQYVEADGRRWSVYLDEGVSCLQNSVVHGPLRIGKNVYIGAGVTLHTAEIGDDSVILHHATVTGGVKIPAGRLVAPGQAVWDQSQADALPPVPAAMRNLNPSSVAGSVELARTYRTQLPIAILPEA